MGKTVEFSQLVVALGLSLLLGACTTTVFRGDIAAFGKGVDETTAAFHGLHARALAKYTSKKMEEFAAKGTVIGVVSDSCTDVTSDGLAKDAGCLHEWAVFRATPKGKKGPVPSCPGASDSVRGGKYKFYDLTRVGEKEGEICRLGVLKPDGSFDSAPLDDAEVLLTMSPKLLPALKGYATALVEIADAADRAALEESVAKAKVRVTKLGQRIDGLDGKTSPFVSTVGPVSDLVGAALIAGLEQRRFKALAAITKDADPVVTQAAMILSNVAMPMTAIELKEAGIVYLKELPDPGQPPRDEAWVPAYARARSARDRYLAIFETSPTPVFKAMADAHHELTLAFSDPKQQYESLKAAIEDFSVKAKAAYDAFEKARAEDQKAKDEAAKKAGTK